MPAEAGVVDRAVSFTKGCYIGQEPVARLHYRGHANRGPARDPARRRPARRRRAVQVEGREVGRVTSAAESPTIGRAVALAIVRREVDPGQRVGVVTDDGVLEGELSAVPAYRWRRLSVLTVLGAAGAVAAALAGGPRAPPRSAAGRAGRPRGCSPPGWWRARCAVGRRRSALADAGPARALVDGDARRGAGRDRLRLQPGPRPTPRPASRAPTWRSPPAALADDRARAARLRVVARRPRRRHLRQRGRADPGARRRSRSPSRRSDSDSRERPPGAAAGRALPGRVLRRPSRARSSGSASTPGPPLRAAAGYASGDEGAWALPVIAGLALLLTALAGPPAGARARRRRGARDGGAPARSVAFHWYARFPMTEIPALALLAGGIWLWAVAAPARATYAAGVAGVPARPDVPDAARRAVHASAPSRCWRRGCSPTGRFDRAAARAGAGDRRHGRASRSSTSGGSRGRTSPATGSATRTRSRSRRRWRRSCWRWSRCWPRAAGAAVDGMLGATSATDRPRARDRRGRRARAAASSLGRLLDWNGATWLTWYATWPGLVLAVGGLAVAVAPAFAPRPRRSAAAAGGAAAGNGRHLRRRRPRRSPTTSGRCGGSCRRRCRCWRCSPASPSPLPGRGRGCAPAAVALLARDGRPRGVRPVAGAAVRRVPRLDGRSWRRWTRSSASPKRSSSRPGCAAPTAATACRCACASTGRPCRCSGSTASRSPRG